MIFPRSCAIAGEHDDGNGHGGVIFFQGFQNIRTADLGQHHVEQDDVGQFLFGDLQGFFAVGGGADQVAGLGKECSVAIRRNLLSSTSSTLEFETVIPSSGALIDLAAESFSAAMPLPLKGRLTGG
jgi:hypothetical protein